MNILGRSDGDESHLKTPTASNHQNGGVSTMTLRQGKGDIGHYRCMSFVAFRKKVPST